MNAQRVVLNNLIYDTGKKRFKFKCEFEISHFHSKFKFYKTDFGGKLDQGAFLVCLVAVFPCLARSR